jgi:hypothetical protein
MQNLPISETNGKEPHGEWLNIATAAGLGHEATLLVRTRRKPR